MTVPPGIDPVPAPWSVPPPNIEGNVMRNFALLAAVAALFALMTAPGSAAPIASLKGVAKQADQVQQVRDGCGRGWYRNRRGVCHRL